MAEEKKYEGHGTAVPDGAREGTEISGPSGHENGYGWVDLGLSVKWAACNVGASRPGDNGSYYAWGEARPKSRYDWNNYFDATDSGGWGIYKIGVKAQIAPDSGHDTARENWGGSWRMPTFEEMEELCGKCKWEQAALDGHKGYKVTGPNGNSIFLPAAGRRYGTSSRGKGGHGHYWSNTINPAHSYSARTLDFGRDHHFTYRIDRKVGLSVRPVTD